MGLPLIPIIAGAVTRLARDNNMTEPICVVVFRTGPKRYAYHNPGMDIKKGDYVLVPTESGVDLEAEVVLMSRADRWGSLATKAVISQL